MTDKTRRIINCELQELGIKQTDTNVLGMYETGVEINELTNQIQEWLELLEESIEEFNKFEFKFLKTLDTWVLIIGEKREFVYIQNSDNVENLYKYNLSEKTKRNFLDDYIFIDGNECIFLVNEDTMGLTTREASFSGEKRFLSNMQSCHITMDKQYQELFPMFKFDDRDYGSSEHLYQALKSDSEEWKDLICDTDKPTKTKTLASELLTSENPKFQIREDWFESGRDNAMVISLFLKYTQSRFLMEKLKEEKGYIEEGNYWDDVYWGVCNGIGENKLGKLLMVLRDQETPNLKELKDSMYE